MNSQEQIWSGSQPVGGVPPIPASKVNQQVAILQKDFNTAQQAVPIRVVYGRALVAGTQMTPIWGFRSEEIKSDSGGGS